MARSGMLLGALLAVPARAMADDCVVTGTSVTLENIRVQPADPDIGPLELDIRALPVRATIRSGALVDLEVGGAIAFKATASKVWWTLAAPAETADHMVSLSAGAHLVDAHADGDSVIADAVLHASDVMVGEAKDPDEKVGPVRVACTKLSLDWAQDDAADIETGGDDTNYRPRKHDNKLALRAAPNTKAAAITVIAPSCGAGCITVERVKSRAGWLLVATANEGVRAAGWIRRSELVRLPDSLLLNRSYMCTGGHGRSPVFGGSIATVGLVESQATLDVGTTIYAAEGDGAWATVIANGPYRVQFVRGASWAVVTAIPGVDGDISAYVPMSAVTLTKP